RILVHVGKVEVRLQHVLLVGAGLGTEAVDGGQDLAGLSRHVLGRIARDLSGEIDHAVVAHRRGETRAGLDALNRHSLCSRRNLSTAAIWSSAIRVGAWPTPSKSTRRARGPLACIALATSSASTSDCAPRSRRVGTVMAS